MKIDLATGLIATVPFYPSPHCDERPEQQIDLIVVHGISLPPKEFGLDYLNQFFLGRLNPKDHPYFAEIAHLRVAPHVLITRVGELVQYVPFHKRAWHAGTSKFNGRENCNNFSIGVELEGADDIPYEKKQYQQLALLVKQLRQTYAIPSGHIVGHDQIAPGRKTDPGPAFDWEYFHQILTEP